MKDLKFDEVCDSLEVGTRKIGLTCAQVFTTFPLLTAHVPFGARVVKAQAWLHEDGMGELYHDLYPVQEYILWELHNALCRGEILLVILYRKA